MRWLATGLLIVGVALELIGLAIVLTDILRAGTALKDFRTRPQNVYIGVAESQEVAGRITAVGGRQPSDHERLVTLESDITSLRDQLDEAKMSLPARWREDIEAARSRVEKSLREYIAAVERVAVGEPESGQRRRLWGVGFLVAGLLVQTSANALSLWAIR